MTSRVMIVGAGAIAQRHAAGCRELPNAELVAVCDVRAEAANRMGDEYGIPGRYSDLGQMLEKETADVAIVSTWGDSHAEVTIALARSGRVRGILCEKPLSRSAAEAVEMARAARENGVLLAEAFRLRHQPIHHRARELIAAGRLGELVNIRSVIGDRSPIDRRRPELNWRFNPRASGGVTYDTGCYCIHHMRWMMDLEPELVHAVGRWGETSGVDEHVVATLQFPGGKTGQFTASWDEVAYQSAEIFGTEAWLRVVNCWAGPESPATRLEIFDAQGNCEVLEFPPISQFAEQLGHMIDCVATGKPHRIPPENSVAQMRVIDAVYQSLRTGQVVRV